MKTQLTILTLACALAIAPSSFAGKKNKAVAAPATPSVMSKYDKNNNGVLDDTEKEAVRAALATDPALKAFDRNSDDKLDDAELAALAKPTPVAEPSKKDKKKKKNKGAAPAETPKTDAPKTDAPKADETKKPQ